MWRNLFPGSFVSHLSRRKSNHLPILLNVRGPLRHTVNRKKVRLFRFEEMWLRDPTCVDMVKDGWSFGNDCKTKLSHTTLKLRHWSREKFGNVSKEIKDCKEEMMNLMQEDHTDEVVAKMRALDQRMDELEAREELYWKQRSRQSWLREGDLNTRFFHAKANQRRERNSIMSIKDNAGNVYDEEKDIEEVLVSHFEGLFTSGGEMEIQPVMEKVKPILTNDSIRMLMADYTGDEVKEALDQIHPTKAPGPDKGLSTLLREAEVKKTIHGVKIGKKVETITHLFFADDSLLFLQATEEEVEEILDILSTYGAASGKKLNMEKSEVSFSRNVDPEKKHLLQQKLHFKAVERHEKYLGLPTYIGTSKKEVFHVIQDRVWKKLKGWKEKFLSQAGREALIKSVAQAIPMYPMQCFEIPSCILDDLEKMCRLFFWGQKGNERKTAWVPWKDLYESKKKGGLGIRNLKAFNKALLAKQAWRILTKGESLMARVLKGKYFPNSSFLEAKIKPNCSYTWRSILSAKSLLSKGLIRIVSDGKTTRIWEDAWVPNIPGFMIPSDASVDGYKPELVEELICDNAWNGNLIDSIFSADAAHEIKKIQLPLYPQEDFWAWFYSRDVEFTVKSAYYIQLQLANSSPSNSDFMSSKLWSKIWRAKLPNKIRNFAWRACKGGLPVMNNLALRGMEVDVCCPVCGMGSETINHMLLGCTVARNVWYLSPLRLDLEGVPNLSFKDVCNHLFTLYKEEQWWSLFWAIAWNIWLNRNLWCFEKKRREVVDIIHRAVGLVNEYEKENSKNLKLQAGQDSPSSWTPPPCGKYKLNTDAGFVDGDRIGLGAILRDYEGDPVMTTCCCVEGVSNVDVAEALAARYGLKISLEAGFRHIIMEVDCLKLFSHVRSNLSEATVFGSIVRDIKKLAESCCYFEVRHVKRCANMAAHHLAKLSSKFSDFRVWLEESPVEIERFVRDDVSSSVN